MMPFWKAASGTHADAAKRSALARYSILMLVWLLSAGYMGANLKRGWVPHDEGILAQAAERVQQGEMPHRDFEDPYTGGLSYLDAAAFRVFGDNLVVLRYVLFAFFLAWVPALFSIARQFSGPWPAASITLLSVLWSVPNYAAAMPSWFCLFFATFGTLAILKYIGQPRIFWLCLAGLCGGCSFLVKSPGLYFVAGILLFFVYREQSLSREGEVPSQRSTIYAAFVFLCLAAFITVLIRLVLPSGGMSEFLYFVLPELAIVVLLLVRESRPTCVRSSGRFGLLLKMATPFLCSVALPIVIFFALYWRHNAIRELVTDLFVLHVKRLISARVHPPHWIFELPSIFLALFLTAKATRDRSNRFASGLKVLIASVLLISCFFCRPCYRLVLHAFWGALPVLTVVAAAVFCIRLKKNERALPFDQQIMLLLSVTALCSLVQFPFAIPIYFCYFAPLMILTIAILLAGLPSPSGFNIGLVAVFAALFAVFIFRPGFLTHMYRGYHSDEQTSALTLPRAKGLRISQQDAAMYDELIPVVQHLAVSGHVLAGPECPEVYFLSGLKNPTAILFDFFREPHEYEELTRGMLDRPNFTNVVVLCETPEFSAEQLKVLQTLVPARFPESRKIGNFRVFWRP